MSPAAPPLVVLTVGTDAHPFDRVVRWVDDWACANPDARVVAQWGTSAPATHAEGAELLPRPELQELLRAADAVVSHGGPATLHQVREVGVLPLCVPRDPAHGEHIDDHQQRFARHQADHGRVRHVATEDELHAALDQVLHDRDAFRIAATHSSAATAAVERFGAYVDALLAQDHTSMAVLHRAALRATRTKQPR